MTTIFKYSFYERHPFCCCGFWLAVNSCPPRILLTTVYWNAPLIITHRARFHLDPSHLFFPAFLLTESGIPGKNFFPNYCLSPHQFLVTSTTHFATGLSSLATWSSPWHISFVSDPHRPIPPPSVISTDTLSNTQYPNQFFIFTLVSNVCGLPGFFHFTMVVEQQTVFLVVVRTDQI